MFSAMYEWLIVNMHKILILPKAWVYCTFITMYVNEVVTLMFSHEPWYPDDRIFVQISHHCLISIRLEF